MRQVVAKSVGRDRAKRCSGTHHSGAGHALHSSHCRSGVAEASWMPAYFGPGGTVARSHGRIAVAEVMQTTH